jgi:hypothetical protein
MLENILIIIGIVLITLFLIFVYLCCYALCKVSSEESRREEEFSIGFLEEINKKS